MPDNFSASHGISENESKQPIPTARHAGIVYVPNPWDKEVYLKLQMRLLEDELGTDGTNVIDATNVRHRMLRRILKAQRRHGQPSHVWSASSRQTSGRGHPGY